MRDIIYYKNATFNKSTRKKWGNICTNIDYLKRFNSIERHEITFARWMDSEKENRIRLATRDELSIFLNAEPRKLSILYDRVPCERFQALARKILAQPMSLDVIEACAAISLDTDRAKIRCERNFSSPDRRGRRQEFLHPAKIEPALEEFCSVWNKSYSLSDDPVPIWLFVSLLNAHPFSDGNGRLARNLLNACISKMVQPTNHLIPFGPLIYATQGNFELAIGRAALMGDWHPIVMAFDVIIGLYCEWIHEFEDKIHDSNFTI